MLAAFYALDDVPERGGLVVGGIVGVVIRIFIPWTMSLCLHSCYEGFIEINTHLEQFGVKIRF